jgi:hypothetical protein
MFQDPLIIKQGFPTTDSQRNSKTKKGKREETKRREEGWKEERKKNKKKTLHHTTFIHKILEEFRLAPKISQY